MELFQAVPSSSILLSASPYEKLEWKVEEVVVYFDAVRVLHAVAGSVWSDMDYPPFWSLALLLRVRAGDMLIVCAEAPRPRQMASADVHTAGPPQSLLWTDLCCAKRHLSQDAIRDERHLHHQLHVAASSLICGDIGSLTPYR